MMKLTLAQKKALYERKKKQIEQLKQQQQASSQRSRSSGDGSLGSSQSPASSPDSQPSRRTSSDNNNNKNGNDNSSRTKKSATNNKQQRRQRRQRYDDSDTESGDDDSSNNNVDVNVSSSSSSRTSKKSTPGRQRGKVSASKDNGFKATTDMSETNKNKNINNSNSHANISSKNQDQGDSDSSDDLFSDWDTEEKKSTTPVQSDPKPVKLSGFHVTKKGEKMHFTSDEEEDDDTDDVRTKSKTTPSQLQKKPARRRHSKSPKVDSDDEGEDSASDSSSSTTSYAKRKKRKRSKPASSSTIQPRRRKYYGTSEEEEDEDDDESESESDNSTRGNSKANRKSRNNQRWKNRRSSNRGGGKRSFRGDNDEEEYYDGKNDVDNSDSDDSDGYRRDSVRSKRRQHRVKERKQQSTGSDDDEAERSSSDSVPPRKRGRKNSSPQMQMEQESGNDEEMSQERSTKVSAKSKNDVDSDDLWSDGDDDVETNDVTDTKTKKSNGKKSSPGSKSKSTQKKSAKQKTTKRRASRRRSSSSSDSDDNKGYSYDDITLGNDYRPGFRKDDNDLKPTLADPKFGPDELVPLYLTRGQNNDSDNDNEENNGDVEDGESHEKQKQAVPAALNRYLAPFQREGVEFMYKVLTSGSGVILGDEMGCGKTVQVIALLCALFNKRGTSHDLEQVSEQKRKANENIQSIRMANNARTLRGEFQLSIADCVKNKTDLKHEIKRSPWSPVLVIVPPSIVETWIRSLAMFSHFSVAEYTSQKSEKVLDFVTAGGADIVLLRKSLFQSEDQFRSINEISWKLVVVDEFHNYKGKKTKVSNNMRKLKKLHDPLMLGMSGTLMQNNHQELWNLIDLIETNFLGSEKDFNENIGKPISYGRQKGAEPHTVARGEKAREHLQEGLAKIMIERKKADVLNQQLTAKTEELVLVDPSPLQKEVYSHVVELPDFDIVKRGNSPCQCGVNKAFFSQFYRLNTRAEQVNYYRAHKKEIVKQSKCCMQIPLNPRRDEPGEPRIDPDAAVWRSMRLHQKDGENQPCDQCPWCCTFPCMKKLIKLSSHVGLIQAEKIAENEQPGSPAYIKYHTEREFAKVALTGVIDKLPGRKLDRSNNINDEHFKLSGKLVVLDRLLTAFYDEGSRVLLFAHSTQLLDLIQTWLKSRGSYEYRRMDGQTDLKLRQNMADEFNKDESIFLFLLSIKATGQGLTLTGANRVIIFDVDWNPSWEEQAQDRAHRIGQTKDVKVVRLISKGTIEEMVYLRQIYKSHLKKETLEDKRDRNISAPRVFRGVQGDKDRKGELFGNENLFRYKDGSFLESIWAMTNGGEAKAKEGRRKMGGVEIHDTEKLSSALHSIGDFERIIEEKDTVDDIAAMDDIATIAAKPRSRTRRTTATRTSAKPDSDSDSDSELDDTLNVQTRAINHNDLMRSDKGGAKTSGDDDEEDVEMGGGTQNAFQAYEAVDEDDLDGSENAEDDAPEDDCCHHSSTAKVDTTRPAADVVPEPNSIFRGVGQPNTSEPSVDASASAIYPDEPKSYAALVPDKIGSASTMTNVLNLKRDESTHELPPVTVGDGPTTSETSKVYHESSSTSPSATAGCQSPQQETCTINEPPLNSRHSKVSGLFGCGDLGQVSTTFSAADLGLSAFSSKKTKKKKSKKKV